MPAESIVRSFPFSITRSLSILLTILLVFPDVQAAAQTPCNSSGWTQLNANLRNNTETFNAVVNNGYLYAIGGLIADTTGQTAGTFLNTVQYVNLDSTTGLATNATAGLMNLTTAQLPTAIVTNRIVVSGKVACTAKLKRSIQFEKLGQAERCRRHQAWTKRREDDV